MDGPMPRDEAIENRAKTQMERTASTEGKTRQGMERHDPPAAWHSRRIVWSVGLVMALIVVGAGAAAYLVGSKPEMARRPMTSLPPLVLVQTLAPQDIRETFVGYGSARADQEVMLAAEVSGRIVAVGEGLKDGSAATEGQALVWIDDRQYGRQLARAESQLADADAQLEQLEVEHANARRLAEIGAQEVDVTRAEYKRLTGLFEKKHASKKEWDFARLAFQRSRREWQALDNAVTLIDPQRARLTAMRGVRLAEKQLADLDVERCTILAPFTGKVEEILVDVGDRVQIGSPILRLTDPRHIEVPIELPASVYSRAKTGSACELTMDSMPGVSWKVNISRLAPNADQQSRTFTAYAEVDNDEQETPLIAGYFLKAEVSGPMLRQVFAIPRGAIVEDHVFVVNSDTAHRKSIRVDRLIGDRAVVSGDLATGDQVILTNLDMLYEGVVVRVDPSDGKQMSAQHDQAFDAASPETQSSTARPPAATELWPRRPACGSTGETSVPQFASRTEKILSTSSTDGTSEAGGAE